MGIFNPAYNAYKNWDHYSDERDGDLDLVGNMHLTEPLRCRRIRVRAAGHIFTDGWPIIASESLNNEGLITADAVDIVGSPAGMLLSGQDGGAGQVGDGDPGVGDLDHGISANGGPGGDAGPNTGGLGGVNGIGLGYMAYITPSLDHFFGMDDYFLRNINMVYAGAGGGGGAGDGVNPGADGGGGGGIISIVTPVITNTGEIRAIGANGAAAAAVGITGGGGGGGGGIIFIRTKTPWGVGTVTVAPGLGGFGFGGGNNGGPGYYGQYQVIQIY